MNRLVISVVTITILALAMQAIKLFDILKRKHLNGLSKIPKSNWNTQINIVSAFMVLTTAQTAYCADDLSGNVVNQNQPSVQFKLQSSNSFNGANIVGPRLTLPEAIERLEGSNERFAVIQSLADVFTAAASETPPARTSYKYRIVNAINSKRAALGNDWDHILRYESGEVKRRVDPFRTVDLNSYLKVAPFVGGAGYLAALLVQKSLPELFVFAYPIAVAALVVPALFIAVFS